ncbi:MAG: DUF1080 domain-containing protein [Bacteroidales bacterium]|nr:DUF1080 domain-containing protein [Bacteroidales bacterium]
MRGIRLCAALLVSGLFLPSASADDCQTKAFLDPSNWEGRSDIWTVQHGKIIGETKQDPKYNTFLISKKKYSDFELSFKVKLVDGVGNSGAQIRSEAFEGTKYRVRGPQVDVGKGYFGSLYGEGVGGMIQAAPKDVVAGAKLDGVNEYHIVAKGSHITIKVNGQIAVDADYTKTPDKKPFPTEGIIAFQAHAGFPKMRVEYSDIHFKILEPGQ